MSDVKTIKFEIVTPEKKFFSGDVRQVTVPTRNGEITILPDHIPLVSALSPGVIEVRSGTGSESEIISVSGGFIEVRKDKIIILADTAERAPEIDLQRAEEARKRAEELRSRGKRMDAEEFARISAKMEKELARTKAVKRWKKIKVDDKSH